MHYCASSAVDTEIKFCVQMICIVLAVSLIMKVGLKFELQLVF